MRRRRGEGRRPSNYILSGKTVPMMGVIVLSKKDRRRCDLGAGQERRRRRKV